MKIEDGITIYNTISGDGNLPDETIRWQIERASELFSASDSSLHTRNAICERTSRNLAAIDVCDLSAPLSATGNNNNIIIIIIMKTRRV